MSDFARWRPRVALGAALGLALALRVWGIAFAPTTQMARPDEDIFISRAFEHIGGQQVHERILSSGWPSGFFLIVEGLLRLEAGVLRLVYRHEVNLGCLHAINPLAVGLVPRVFSALAGTLACWLVGCIVYRLSPAASRRHGAVLGALALGCCYLAARDAHFGVSDATLVALLVLSLYFCIRAVQDGAAWLCAAAGAGAFAFGVKYSGAAAAVPCLVAAVGCVVRSQRRWRALLWIGIASVCAMACFALIERGALLHPQQLLRSMLVQKERYTAFAHTTQLDWSAHPPLGAWFHIKVTLPGALGWMGLACGIGGIGLAVARDRWAGAALAGSVIAAYAMIAPAQSLFVRYAAPMLPGLCAGLGVALVAAADWGRRRGLRGGVLVGAAIALVLLVPTIRIIQFDRLLARPDTRDLASEWLLAQGPDATVEAYGSYARIHSVSADAQRACATVLPPALERRVPLAPPDGDWSELVARGRQGWADISTRSMSTRGAGRFQTQGWLLLECGRPSHSEYLTPLDSRCWQPVASFSPGAPKCGSYVDLFDWFFVPYAGLDGPERGGPETRVYRNRCLP